MLSFEGSWESFGGLGVVVLLDEEGGVSLSMLGPSTREVRADMMVERRLGPPS